MEKFIRLDMKGHWRGTEHRSSMNGLAGEWDDESENSWEEGISCYSLENVAGAVDDLRQYWTDIASVTEEDYKNMQVTIFEGEKIGMGSDYEDLAICEKTVVEADALPFIQQVIEAYDSMEYEEEITEEEYNSILEKLVSELMGAENHE